MKFDQDEKQIYFRSLKDEQEAARSAQNRKEIAPALELFRKFYQSDDESYIDLIEEKTDQLGFERLQPLSGDTQIEENPKYKGNLGFSQKNRR